MYQQQAQLLLPLRLPCEEPAWLLRAPPELGGCNSEQNLALHISEQFCDGLALD